MGTRIKICGISRREDALHAVQLGVDAIGLVFYPPSPRAVDVPTAVEVVKSLPPFVTVVALFVDPTLQEVQRVVQAVPVDLIQFHGDESPQDCDRLSLAAGRTDGLARSYIKAIRMQDGTDVSAEAKRYAGASALLLDAYRPGVPGGTGEAFEWSRVPADLDKPIVLAGGLNPGNVAQAIHQVRPYAVDVSGGVEVDGSKGVKDQAKMTAFVRAVRAADQHFNRATLSSSK